MNTYRLLIKYILIHWLGPIGCCTSHQKWYRARKTLNITIKSILNKRYWKESKVYYIKLRILKLDYFTYWGKKSNCGATLKYQNSQRMKFIVLN